MEILSWSAEDAVVNEDPMSSDAEPGVTVEELELEE